MASALSLRADTEFAREVKAGEEPREKGKAAPGLRAREPPQRRHLSETGAESRVAGRAESAPSSTNQQAFGPSSDTRGSGATEGRPKEGLRGCSSRRSWAFRARRSGRQPCPGSQADVRLSGA